MTDYTTRRIAMVDGQVRPSDVTSFPIISAMLDIPRERFVPGDQRGIAYADCQIRLSGDRIMLEPRTLSRMIQVLDVQGNDLVLVIGAGTGYGVAVLARLAQMVIGIEEDEALAAEAREALAAQSADNALVETLPLADGAGAHAPFDAILVEGGAVHSIPPAILDQLRDGGRIAALFSDGAIGQCRIGIRSAGAVTWRYAFDAWAPVMASFTRPREFQL